MVSQFIEIGNTGREFELIGKLQIHIDMHWIQVALRLPNTDVK